MPELEITNFRGVFQKSSTFDLPDVYAETCKDLLPTYEGKLIKRDGYATATLNSVAFSTDTTTTVALGTIQSMYELVTGRDTTSAPNEARIYLAQTSAGNGRLWRWREDQGTWHDLSGDATDMRDVDGTVQPATFLDDDGIIRLLTGDRSVNFPLWWGYTGERFTNAYSSYDGTKTAVSGAFLTAAVNSTISKPDANSYLTKSEISQPAFATWVSLVAEGIKPELNYHYYKIAFQYDNKQWTLPSKSTAYIEIPGSLDKRIRLDIAIPNTIDQRITGIAIFKRMTPTAGQWDSSIGDYYLVLSTYFNAAFGSFASPNYKIWPYDGDFIPGTYATATTDFTISSSITGDNALGTDLYNNCLIIARKQSDSSISYRFISDTQATAANAQKIVVSDGTGLTDGADYDLIIVGGWWLASGSYKYTIVDDLSKEALESFISMTTFLGITDETITDVYPKYGTMVNGQAFYASAWHADETKSYIVPYGMITPSGLVANDVHPILNAFTPGFPIKGISSVGDRLIIYGNDKISRGILPSTNETSWDFEKLFDEYGLLAEDSLINISGKDYFLATDWQIKVFDGSIRPQAISDGIYTQLHAAGDASIAYLQAAKATYMPKLNMYMIKFQTGASTYEYWAFDVAGQLGWIQFAWHVTTTSTDQNFTGFFRGQNGNSFAHASIGVFLLNSGTDDGGIDISPSYISHQISSNSSLEHHLRQLSVTYQADTQIKVDIYLDNSASALTQVDDNFAAQTSIASDNKGMPLGSRCRNFRFKVSLESTDIASNTDLELDRLSMTHDISGGAV